MTNVSIKTGWYNDVLIIKASGIIRSVKDDTKYTSRLIKEIQTQKAKKIIINELALIQDVSMNHQIIMINKYINDFPIEIMNWKVAVVLNKVFKKEIVILFVTLLETIQ